MFDNFEEIFKLFIQQYFEINVVCVLCQILLNSMVYFCILHLSLMLLSNPVIICFMNYATCIIIAMYILFNKYWLN